MVDKVVPLRLQPSTRAQLAAAKTATGLYPVFGRLGYLADGDNALLLGNGTTLPPLEYPPRTSIAVMIADAIEDAGAGGTGSVLVLPPTITGATTAAAGAAVTFTASGSVSAFAAQGATIAKYTWTKPDGTTVDGASLTVNASATAGVGLVIKCKATDSIGNTSSWSIVTLTTAANAPPSTPTATTPLPATVTRGASYNVVLSATNPEGGAVTFRAESISGCTVTLSGSTAVVDVGDTATSLSVSFRSVDSSGLQSTAALVVSRSGTGIVNPTGSVTVTPGTTQTIAIPDGAATLTLVGTGGPGVAGKRAYYCFPDRPPYISGVTPNTIYDGEFPSTVNVTSILSGITGTYKYYAMEGTDYVRYYHGSTFATSDANFYYVYDGTKSTAASAGQSTTVSGAVSAVFAGATAGVITAPAVTTQVKTLPTGTGRSVTVTLPLGASLTATWS